MVDLLSASIFGFGFGFVFVFFVFVRERVRKSEEVPPMKHSFVSHTQEEDQKGQGIDGCDFTSVHHFPFPFACSSANSSHSKTISLILFLF